MQYFRLNSSRSRLWRPVVIMLLTVGHLHAQESPPTPDVERAYYAYSILLPGSDSTGADRSMSLNLFINSSGDIVPLPYQQTNTVPAFRLSSQAVPNGRITGKKKKDTVEVRCDKDNKCVICYGGYCSPIGGGGAPTTRVPSWYFVSTAVNEDGGLDIVVEQLEMPSDEFMSNSLNTDSLEVYSAPAFKVINGRSAPAQLE